MQAASRSARVFNRELGKLVRLRTEAVEQGQVVLQDRIVLEYEAQGLVLAAKRGETRFDAKDPQPRTDEVVAELDRQRAGAQTGTDPSATAEPAPAPTAARSGPPTAPEPPAAPAPEPEPPEAPVLDVRV